MVTMRFFASIKDKMGAEMMELDIDTPVTLRDLLVKASEQAGAGPDMLLNGSFLYAVNQEMRGLEHNVEDSDEVAVLPPLSGGI